MIFAYPHANLTPAREKTLEGVLNFDGRQCAYCEICLAAIHSTTPWPTTPLRLHSVPTNNHKADLRTKSRCLQWCESFSILHHSLPERSNSIPGKQGLMNTMNCKQSGHCKITAQSPGLKCFNDTATDEKLDANKERKGKLRALWPSTWQRCVQHDAMRLINFASHIFS